MNAGFKIFIGIAWMSVSIALYAVEMPSSVSNAVPDVTQMVVRVTGYCNCGTCCSWRRSWFGLGRPVYSKGRLKGRPKKVGVTSRGTVAKKGTIAADLAVFPFGTQLKVPGYGMGVVEDTGGAVQGNHIDLWFPTHAEARAWGTKELTIEVRRPEVEKTEKNDMPR